MHTRPGFDSPVPTWERRDAPDDRGAGASSALTRSLVGLLPAFLAPPPPDRVEGRRADDHEDAVSHEQVAA